MIMVLICSIYVIFAFLFFIFLVATTNMIRTLQLERTSVYDILKCILLSLFLACNITSFCI